MATATATLSTRAQIICNSVVNGCVFDRTEGVKLRYDVIKYRSGDDSKEGLGLCAFTYYLTEGYYPTLREGFKYNIEPDDAHGGENCLTVYRLVPVRSMMANAVNSLETLRTKSMVENIFGTPEGSMSIRAFRNHCVGGGVMRLQEWNVTEYYDYIADQLDHFVRLSSRSTPQLDYDDVRKRIILSTHTVSDARVNPMQIIKRTVNADIQNSYALCKLQYKLRPGYLQKWKPGLFKYVQQEVNEGCTTLCMWRLIPLQDVISYTPKTIPLYLHVGVLKQMLQDGNNSEVVIEFLRHCLDAEVMLQRGWLLNDDTLSKIEDQLFEIYYKAADGGALSDRAGIKPSV